MASSMNRDLIPIFYRLPFNCEAEIVSGYLEKKKLPHGSKTKKFYGQFECLGCNGWWKSSNTYQGYTQGCKKCRTDSWPIKVYHLEQSADAGARGPHISSLCERCRELGHNCNTGADLDDNINVNNRTSHNRNNPVTIYDQCYQKQYQLLHYEIILEPNFIRDLYARLWDGLSDRERGEFKLGLETALNEWIKKRRDDLVRVCQEILRQIRARSSQNLPVIPNHDPSHVLPDQNQSYVLPDQNPSHVLAEQNRSYMLPDQNRSYMLPDQNRSHVLPDQNPSHVLAEQNRSYMLPDQNRSYMLPDQNRSYMLPDQNRLHVLPDQNRSYVLPDQNRSYVLPDQNRSYMLPDQNRSYVLPDQIGIVRPEQFTRATAEVGIVGIVAQVAAWLFGKAFGNS